MKTKAKNKPIRLFFLAGIPGAIVFLLVFNFYPALSWWDDEDEAVVIETEKEITVKYNSKSFSIDTWAKTIGELLNEEGLEVAPEDYLFPVKETELSSGMVVTIVTQTPVSIKVDGETVELKTFAESVEQVLAEAQVSLSHLDEVEPGKSTRLFNGMEIEVTRINVEEVTETEIIEYDTITKEDPEVRWRKKVVTQEGETGEEETVYEITYENGEQVSREVLSSKVLKKPVNEIISEGTKIEVGKVSKGRASWYKHTGDLKCASLEHPIGTWLKVTNQDNGKSVIVQVNDRGPFSEDKIIDLDAVAFKKIGNLGQGVVRVKVEEILE